MAKDFYRDGNLWKGKGTDDLCSIDLHVGCWKASLLMLNAGTYEYPLVYHMMERFRPYPTT